MGSLQIAYTLVLMALWLFIIIAETFRNYYIIEVVKDRPNYLQSFIIRGMVALVHAILFNPHNFHEWLPILIYQCATFFVIFSPLLNFTRNESFFYLGKTSGIIDPFLLRYPALHRLLYFLSCLLVVISTVIIVLMYGGSTT